jgi:restriction endonuclease Mrr
MHTGTERVRPLLSYLTDSQQKSTRAVTDAMTDEFGLTAEKCARMIPSGTAKLTNNREILWESETTATDAEVRAKRVKSIRETGANNPAIGYNRAPRYHAT